MKIITLLLFLPVSFILHAQKKKEVIHVFDKEWKPCDPSKAVFMASVTRPDDSTYQWNYYHFTGPILSIESYKDERSEIANGYFAWFDSLGRIDSSGFSLLGRKHGHWHYYSDKMTIRTTIEYENGKLVKQTDWDSVNKKPKKPDDKPAEFRSGNLEWSRYIGRSFKYPEWAQKNGFTGTVVVGFIIDTTGKILQPHLVKSIEYSMDMEALRVIRAAPAWNPAITDGKKTSAYHRQPIAYMRQN
jgi:periplasmic protein TonB